VARQKKVLEHYLVLEEEQDILRRSHITDTVAQGSDFSHDHFQLIFQVLTIMCRFGNAVSFRFNSIDVKFQIWKLGVVFTDNVSLAVSNYLCFFLGLFMPHCSANGYIKVSLPVIYVN